MIRALVVGAVALFLLLAERAWYRRIWNQGLTARIRFLETGVSEGEEGHLLEEIENRKRIPLFLLQCKFQTNRSLLFPRGRGSATTDQFYRSDVFQVGANERLTRRLTFTGGARGYFTVRSLDLIASDPFFVDTLIAEAECEASIYIYPRKSTSAELFSALSALNANRTAFRPPVEEPFSFRGIREYEPYDDLRSINWKASAKAGELLVNQREFIALRPVRVFLNLEDSGILKKPEAQEECFRVAAGIAWYYLVQSIPVTISGNVRDALDGRLLHVRADGNGILWEEMLQALARADLEQEVPFAKQYAEELLTPRGEEAGAYPILVAPNLYSDFLAVLGEMEERGMDFKLFLPVEGGDEPQLPEGIAGHTTVLRIA